MTLHSLLSRAAGLVLAAASVTVLASCRTAGSTTPASPVAAATGTQPTLVVFITVDQFASSYVDRYRPEFTGGLKRLTSEGALWLYGLQDNGITETAPGHASTMSGRFPVHTGIAMNSQGVNTPDAPLIGSNDAGASPFRFRGTTLYDWMKAAHPQTRVLSVSRKDRGAILPIGKAKVDVYWYASEGYFTTSTYYRNQLPEWVRWFNGRRGGQNLAGHVWNLLMPVEQYANTPDSVPAETASGDYLFPHAFPSDSNQAASAARGTPYLDSLTFAFALEGLQQLQLGARSNRTDLLAVSLSSTDAVGHNWGPDSREAHDQLLRLDRWMGQFLDSLFTLRDQRRIVIALTADHGMSPSPDVRSAYFPNQNARRVDTRPAARAVREKLAADGIPAAAVSMDEVFEVVDSAAFRRAGQRPDVYARLWVEELRKIPGVLRADMLTDIAQMDTVRDNIARRWLHQFHPGGAVLATLTLERFNYFFGTNYATHGSPHDQDAQVPVLFWGAGIRGGAREGQARVVDMAPTLASWIGVTPLEPLDGRVLPLAP